MSLAGNHHKIHYIEFAASDVARAKQFYSGAKSIYSGPESGGIAGGFRLSKPEETTGSAAPLIVLYSKDLRATEAAIVAAGGAIVVPTFEFPGGRRFHFSDGVGNVLAVWSE